MLTIDTLKLLGMEIDCQIIDRRYYLYRVVVLFVEPRVVSRHSRRESAYAIKSELTATPDPRVFFAMIKGIIDMYA